MRTDQGSESFQIRVMSREDLRNTYAWSIDEGWNIGKYDHDVFFATDPEGFFLGVLDGKPIGSVSGVAYDDHFGFIGLYILEKNFRGQGYGIQLFNAALKHLGARNIGLDAVVEQQDNYRKSGFKLAYRNVRYSWTPPTGLSASAGIVAASTIPFAELADYDALHFPALREVFLRGWLAEPESNALVYRQNDKITGYGMIRQFHSGCCIGPLFANTDSIASQLFEALCASRSGQTVYIDIPEPNISGPAFAKRYSLSPVFENSENVHRAATTAAAQLHLWSYVF